jgi:hypothetical protein
MRIPLYVCDVPSAALREETRNFERSFEIDDEESAPTVD